MPTPDEKFEIYLRQFHPSDPEPLLLKTRVRMHLAAYTRTIFAAGIAIAALVIVAILLLYPQEKHLTQSTGIAPVGKPYVEASQPFTIRSANARLAASSSFKTAIDEIAFPGPATPLPQNMHSALAALGKGPTL